MTFETQVTEHAFSFTHIADTASKRLPNLEGYFIAMLSFIANKVIYRMKERNCGHSSHLNPVISLGFEQCNQCITAQQL